MQRVYSTVLVYFAVLIMGLSIPSPAAVADYIPIAPLGIEGNKPAVAVADDGTVHLVYVKGADFCYRQLSPNLVPGDEQVLFTFPNMEDKNVTPHGPVIALDKNGNPHAAISDGHTYNPNTYYFNKINGSWTTAVVVWNSGEMKSGRSTIPTMAIDDDLTVYMGLFTMGDNKRKFPEGGLVKIDNSGAAPVVVVREGISAWVPHVMLAKGKLWVCGRFNTRWQLQEFDKSTLKSKGPLMAITGRTSEANVGIVDHNGEMHFAGASLNNNPENAGWYATMSMLLQGKSNHSFTTTRHNPCAMTLPVVDKKVDGRVYLFHWSDDSTTANESPACTPVRYTLFENGERIKNNEPLDSDRNRRFGKPKRVSPSAAALPGGGVLLVYDMCDTQLYFQTLSSSQNLASPVLSQKLRVITETDIGGDPDDQASLVRFLMYANEWDIEGIIADRLPSNFNDPELLRHRIRYRNEKSPLAMTHLFLDAYETIRPNLVQHADGYPTADYLRSITVAGHEDTDDGVNLILHALAKDDPRSIWFSNWGSNGKNADGSFSVSNLKRALDIFQEQDNDLYEAALAKIRNVSLDGNAPGFNRQGVHYEKFPLNVETGWPEKYGTGYGTRWYHQFRQIAGADKADVATNHGPLGKLWTGPKEGDTWCFMYYIPIGLSDPSDPTLGGWAGRYGARTDAFNGPGMFWNDEEDNYPGTNNDSRPRNITVARYEDAPRRDFIARMDWAVKNFAEANHPPTPTLIANGQSVTMGILAISAAPGSTVNLSATTTDPDDGDTHAFRYVYYQEASSYNGNVNIQNPTASSATFTVPSDAKGKDIHVYLEVTDNGSRKGGGVPDLTRYCRVIVAVE